MAHVIMSLDHTGARVGGGGKGGQGGRDWGTGVEGWGGEVQS